LIQINRTGFAGAHDVFFAPTVAAVVAAAPAPA
jgi:hypothetical protein